MEGEHGTSCRFPLPAAISPLPDSMRKESTVHLPLSTSSSNLSTSRLTEEGEHLHTLVVPALLLKNIYLEIEILPVSHRVKDKWNILHKIK
jgi:hypothetical protein